MTKETTPPSETARNNRILLWLVIVITLAGVAARFIAWEKVEFHYFDEAYYLKFTKFHAGNSLTDFASYVEAFTNHQ